MIPLLFYKGGVPEKIIIAPQMVFINPAAKQNLMTLFSHIVDGQQQEHWSSAQCFRMKWQLFLHWLVTKGPICHPINSCA